MHYAALYLAKLQILNIKWYSQLTNYIQHKYLSNQSQLITHLTTNYTLRYDLQIKLGHDAKTSLFWNQERKQIVNLQKY